ncbi:D-glucuronyl C5-epimerase family protein, partial [Pseudomonas aeruginosa]
VDGDIASWPLPFRDKNFDLDPGWISGIGQSRIAGVLLRAEAITDDAELHEIARKALHAYDVDIKDGGVVTVDDQVTW